MTRKNVLIAIAVVARRRGRRRREPVLQEGQRGSPVTTETIKTRDLEAIVSASGKIQPKRLVNISADTVGPRRQPRGQRRRPDQEGPVPAADRSRSRCSTRVDNGAASLQGGRSDARSDAAGGRDGARRSSSWRSRTLKRQQDLWNQQLTTRETLDKARERREGGRVGAARAREDGQRAGEPHRAGARRRSTARSTT